MDRSALCPAGVFHNLCVFTYPKKKMSEGLLATCERLGKGSLLRQIPGEYIQALYRGVVVSSPKSKAVGLMPLFI